MAKGKVSSSGKAPAYASLDPETKGLIKSQLYSSSAKSLTSGFADIANGLINYSSMKVEAGFMGNQADSIELQASEQANAIRDEFIGAVGNANYDAARRGVKVSSANVRDNINNSAASLDKDTRKLEENAASQARMVRMQAKLKKRQAKTAMFTGLMSGVSNIANGAATGYAGYKMGE